MENSVIEIVQPEYARVITCTYSGVGCSFKATVRGEELVRVVPYKDGKTNHGHSCIKGRFAVGYVKHPERIAKPMMRERLLQLSAEKQAGLHELVARALPNIVIAREKPKGVDMREKTNDEKNLYTSFFGF